MQSQADSGAPPAEGPQLDPGENRRNFIAAVASVVVGAMIGLVPLLAGAVMFLDPLLRRKEAGENFLRVATLEAVPDDGVPRRFPVLADRVNAWNRTPNEPIGSVYLRRDPGSKVVTALSAICPHAGCFVAYDEAGGRYQCPCHTSAFSQSGERIEPTPSPRDMDPLQVKLRGSDVLVNYVNFYPGTEERVRKA